MGLRSSIQSVVNNAFATIGDIAETITYTTKSSSEYDMYTGTTASINSAFNFKAIVESIGGAKTEGEITSGHTGEVSAMFPTKELTFTPKTDDTITRGAEVYSISDIQTDPANATYTLVLRRLG